MGPLKMDVANSGYDFSNTSSTWEPGGPFKRFIDEKVTKVNQGLPAPSEQAGYGPQPQAPWNYTFPPSNAVCSHPPLPPALTAGTPLSYPPKAGLPKARTQAAWTYFLPETHSEQLLHTYYKFGCIILLNQVHGI